MWEDPVKEKSLPLVLSGRCTRSTPRPALGSQDQASRTLAMGLGPGLDFTS